MTHSPDAADAPDLSFLAPSSQLADWRFVLAYEAASEAGALDAIPASLDQVATRCALDPDGLRPVLGVLAAWHVLEVDGAGVYAAGPKLPSTLDDAILRRHGSTIRRWSAMLAPRLRDRPAEPAPAEIPVMAGTTEPNLLAINARRLTREIVDACLDGTPRVRRALDLGGGHGEHALELTRRGVSTVLQDLPPVLAAADADGRLSTAGIDLFDGDLRTTLPEGPFDLVLCSTVTNMFDPAVNADLFRRLRAVLAPEGTLAIVSYLRGRDEVAAVFGLQMLAWTDGGDAHSLDDYRRWLDDAGLRITSVQEFVEPSQTMVLARPNGR